MRGFIRTNATSLFCCFALLAIPVCAPGQNSAPSSQKLELQRQRALAISLIKQTADEAILWDDKATAVEVLADASDALWVETPIQSAAWLTKAWSLIDQISEVRSNETLKDYFTSSNRNNLRTIVLNVARKHDAKLAEKFLKQLTDSEAEGKRDRGAFDDQSVRSQQLLRLAQQVIDTNPEDAFSLAARSLTDGISYSLQNILTTLRKKNVGLANQLFDLALTRFSGAMSSPAEAEVLAGYLFQSGFTFSSNPSGQVILVVNPAQQGQPPVAKSEPERARNFLVAAYQTLLNRPIPIDTTEGRQRAQKVLVFGNRIISHYQGLAPEFATPARAFLTQLQNELLPSGEAGPFGGAGSSGSGSENSTRPRTNEEIYNDRLAELEERADKETNPIAKKLSYVTAALAPTPADYQRAKHIAEKISDENLRDDTVSFVLYRAALFFVTKGQTETAMEIAPLIKDRSRRSVVRIAIVQRFMTTAAAERVDPSQLNPMQQRMFDLLSEVESDLKKEEPSSKVAKLILARTALLAKLDRAQSMVSLEQALEVINKLEQFNIKDSSAPDLALAASEISGATVATPRIGFDFRSAIESRVKTDFEQIVALVERFKSKPVRGIARLQTAKLFLSGTD